MLEFQNVTIRQGTFLLENLNFKLEEGYLAGILGANGAGKTTLLHSMLEYDCTCEGEILFQGRNIAKEKDWFLGQCAYIAEDVTFLKKETALTNVKMLGAFYEQMDFGLFTDYMKQMKLSPSKKIGAMSRGQLIKFQIAFARARKAKLYLMDEVTAGMDPVFRREFYNMLRELLEEGATILMTTHIEADVNRNMDYICRLEKGRMVSFKESIEE